jgi:hypothetical protein
MSKKYYKGFDRDMTYHEDSAELCHNGETFKANTWYRCKDGRFVEVEDDE